jgi:hypothetical protein
VEPNRRAGLSQEFKVTSLVVDLTRIYAGGGSTIAADGAVYAGTSTGIYKSQG